MRLERFEERRRSVALSSERPREARELACRFELIDDGRGDCGERVEEGSVGVARSRDRISQPGEELGGELAVCRARLGGSRDC